MDRWRIGEEVLQEPKRIKGETGKRRILPLDVTIEILSSLPAKSLVRFRRVCKLWQSITHNPHFIESHLRKTRARPPTLLLFPYQAYRFMDPKFTITRLDGCDDPFARLNPKPLILGYVLLYASCNGLLCLSHFETTTTLVVNPATGDSLSLPPSTHSCRMRFRPHMSYFGFEPVTKEYKVLATFTDNDALVCELYTLGTDSAWRQIHAPPDFCTFHHKGLALKGSIYWRRHYPDDRALRFDLKDERFHPITLPSFEFFYKTRNYHHVGRHFIELQGSLCLPVFPNLMVVRPRMDIWAMTSSNNIEHEWSIKYSVLFPWDHCRQPRPLLIHNDKILVHDHHRGTRLRYHDLRPNSNGGDNSYKKVYHQDRDSYMEPFVHVESLVPLPN